MSRLLTFFLGLGWCLTVWSATTYLEDTAFDSTPQWIAHPAAPGPDIPSDGRSLFDQLFASSVSGELRYHVPFPFEALRASLAARVELGDSGALLQVLIPQGRSLHREAAAPDYFKSPRVVLAVDAPPRMVEHEAGLSLPRRFYVGYQERIEQLEVISYNDDAGRFEFQVVEDYAAGKTPTVRYASRALCMSCHQNAGPIFSNTPWRETNFDTEVAKRIAEEQPDRYQTTMAALSGHDAALLDYSTDRANYFLAYQLLWQKACGGEDPDDEESVRCRAGVLKAILQFRLSGDIAYDHATPRYLATLRTFYRNWRSRWPGGLYVATADIPDRSPFETQIRVATLDPLIQRAPQAFWPEPIDMVAGGMVTRLSEFIIDADIKRYDEHLSRTSQESAKTVYRSSCEIQPGSPRLTGAPIKFVCGDRQSLQAYIELVVQRDQVVGGHIFELHLPGDTYLWSANFKHTVLSKATGRTTLKASLLSARGNHARVADGRRLDAVMLEWPGNDYTVDLIGGEAALAITLVDEFSPLENAIEAMVAESLSGESDTLSSRPFRRRQIVSDLNRHLGLAALDWCCDLPSVATSQTVTVKPISFIAPVRNFQQNCGLCHSGDGRYPPGFLNGSESEIRNHLTECAPRILRRLGLWNQTPQSRTRSPMPPVSSLALLGHDESSWHASDTKGDLAGHARALLTEALGEQEIARFADIDYDALPPCDPH